jgi:hypothetical protein
MWRLGLGALIDTRMDRGVDSLSIPMDALNGTGILCARSDAGKGQGKRKYADGLKSHRNYLDQDWTEKQPARAIPGDPR